MLKLLLVLLVSTCVAIHGVGMILGLRWLGRTPPHHRHHFSLPAMFWILIRVVYGLLLLHLLQIVVWAACYQWSGCFPDFATSFYYSATSYSTVGYGDVIPPGNWRILGAVEAVTGILMFGWRPKTTFELVHVYRDPIDVIDCPLCESPGWLPEESKSEPCLLNVTFVELSPISTRPFSRLPSRSRDPSTLTVRTVG